MAKLAEIFFVVMVVGAVVSCALELAGCAQPGIYGHNGLYEVQARWRF